MMSSASNAFVSHTWTLLPEHPIYFLEWNSSTVGVLLAIVFFYVIILSLCALLGPYLLRSYIYTRTYYQHVYNREDSEQVDIKQILAQEPDQDADTAYMEWAMLKSGESAWWIQVGFIRPLLTLILLLTFQIDSSRVQISLVLFVTCYTFEVLHLFIGSGHARQYKTISAGLRQFALCHHAASLIIFVTAYTSQTTATNTSLYPKNVSQDKIITLILRSGLSVTMWEFQGGFFTLVHHCYVSYLDYQRCTQPMFYSRIQFYQRRRLSAILQRSANLISSWAILLSGLWVPDVTVGFLVTWLIAAALMNTIDTAFTIRTVKRITHKIQSIRQEQEQDLGQELGQVQILINGKLKAQRRTSHLKNKNKNKSTMDMDMSMSASCSSADESPSSSQPLDLVRTPGPVGRILNLLIPTSAVYLTSKSQYTLANLKPPLSPHNGRNATDSESEGGSTNRSNGSDGSNSNNQTPRWIQNPLFEAPPEPEPASTPTFDPEQPQTSRKVHVQLVQPFPSLFSAPPAPAPISPSLVVDALTSRSRSRYVHLENESLTAPIKPYNGNGSIDTCTGSDAEKEKDDMQHMEMDHSDMYSNNNNHHNNTITTTNIKSNSNSNSNSNSSRLTSPLTSRRTVPTLPPPPAFSTPAKFRRIAAAAATAAASSDVERQPVSVPLASTSTSPSPSMRQMASDVHVDAHKTTSTSTSTSTSTTPQFRSRNVQREPYTSRKSNNNSNSNSNSNSEMLQTSPVTARRASPARAPLASSPSKVRTSRRMTDIDFVTALRSAKTALSDVARQPLTSRHVMADADVDVDVDVDVDKTMSITQPLTSRKRNSASKNNNNSNSTSTSTSTIKITTPLLTGRRTVGILPSVSPSKVYASRRIMGIDFAIAQAASVAERQPLTSRRGRVITSHGDIDGDVDHDHDNDNDSEGEDEFHVHDDNDTDGELYQVDESNMGI